MALRERQAVSRRAEADGPPYVGALLRLCWQQARARLNEAVRAAGFTDLQDAHLSVFAWPLPEGERPSDLARRIGASRQAANHLLAQMEAMGYLERRSPAGSERRLVYVTSRGWRVAEAIWASMRGLQQEWAEEVGAEKFADFLAVLRQLAHRPE